MLEIQKLPNGNYDIEAMSYAGWKQVDIEWKSAIDWRHIMDAIGFDAVTLYTMSGKREQSNERFYKGSFLVPPDRVDLVKTQAVISQPSHASFFYINKPPREKYHG